MQGQHFTSKQEFKETMLIFDLDVNCLTEKLEGAMYWKITICILQYEYIHVLDLPQERDS